MSDNDHYKLEPSSEETQFTVGCNGISAMRAVCAQQPTMGQTMALRRRGAVMQVATRFGWLGLCDLFGSRVAGRMGLWAGRMGLCAIVCWDFSVSFTSTVS